MRTDIIIDKKQVKLPNASTIGFGQWKARVGDLIIFSDGQRQITGRMIGRIARARALDGDKDLKNYLVCICVADSLDHVYERWVDPKDVFRAERFNHEYSRRQDVMKYFMSDDMLKADINEVRTAASDGWSTLDRYRADQEKRKEEMADYDRRHPMTDEHQAECDFCQKYRKTIDRTKEVLEVSE